MRQVARGLVELTGTVFGLSSMARRVRRGNVAILAYHNVVQAEEAGQGDASLHMPLPDFLDQIERLARTHRIVDLETALNRTASDRPLAVITFDDAYRGAVTLGLPELARRGFPAVVFVSPGLLGADSTWWDELAEAGRLSSETRRSALVDLAGRAEAVRARFLDGRAVPRLPRSYGIATVQELREHCGGNFPLGSHAWGHEHLPSLERADLGANLVRTREWLAGLGLPVSPWLALPYGEGSPGVSRVARALGHAGVLRISGGLWNTHADRTRVPRINVPAGITVRGLELRTSGLRS